MQLGLRFRKVIGKIIKEELESVFSKHTKILAANACGRLQIGTKKDPPLKMKERWVFLVKTVENI